MRHRALFVAVVGLAAIASAEGTTGAVGRLLAVQSASALLASLPGLRVGRVSSGGGVVAIDDVDYRGGDGTWFHVGRLTVPGGPSGLPGFVGSAAADPAGITATDVTISIRHSLITVPRMEAQGTYLTADRLKALLDPATALPIAERLKDLTAASLTAPNVTITAVGPVPGTSVPPNPDDDGKATLEDVVLTDVVGGRIGSLSVRKTTVFKTAAANSPTVATLGPVALNGLDLPLVLRIAQTGRTDAAERPQTIYGSLSVRDILVAPDETASIRIGTIAADGFRGRPLLRRPAEIVALLDKPSAPQTPDDVQSLANTAVDAAKGFSLDHLEWDDVALEAKSKDQVLLKLGRFAMDGLSPVQVGTWALNDLAVTTGDASVTLDRMTLHTPDESQYIDILAHELATSGLAMDRTKLVGGIPQDGSMSLLGLHVEVPDATRSGNGSDGNRNVFDVPVLSFASATDPATGIATSTAHAQATYVLPPVSGNPGISALVRNRLKGIDARADYRMIFDPRGQEMRVDPLTVSAEKLGRISASVDVGNVPFDLLARGRPSGDAQAALDKMTFKGLSVDFRNDGVVDLALPLLAASSDKSVAMLKVAAKTQSDLFIGKTLGTTPAAQRLEAAIDAFIDDPKNLHIAITAPQGLTGAEIEASPDPKSLLDRVGIEAAANR